MVKLPKEILFMIRNYIGCYIDNKNFFISSKLLNNLNCCRLRQYKSLSGCIYHSKYEYNFPEVTYLEI